MIAKAALLPGFGKSMWALACSQCYLTSSVLTGSAGHALDKGVLVLGLPPLTMFLGILFYLHRRSRAWHVEPAGGQFQNP